MDREKFVTLLGILNAVVGEDGENCPTLADLDYDECAMQIYYDVVQLKSSLENYGF